MPCDRTTGSFARRHRRARSIASAVASIFAIACAPRALATSGSQNFPSAALWTVPIAARPIGNPVAFGERVFLPLQTGVSARRLADGEEIWSVQMDVDGPLAAAKDRLFVPTKGELRGLDSSSGRVAWTDHLGPVTAAPVIHDDLVLVASGVQLVAYRVADGSRQWTTELGTVEQRPAVQGPRAYVAIADGRLAAVDTAAGKVLWEYFAGVKPSEPYVHGDRVFIGSARRTFCSVNAATGKEEWCFRVGAAIIGAAVADASRVYFVALDHLLYALDRRSGALRWKTDLKYRPSAGPMLVGRSVSAPGLSPRLQAFDTGSGKPNSQLTLAHDLAGVPVVIPAADGGAPRLAALAGSLENLWTLTLATAPPDLPPPPAVTPLSALPGQVIPIAPPQAPAGVR